MTRVLAANWKMNLSLGEARSLYAALRDAAGRSPSVTMLVFAPFTALAPLADVRARSGGSTLGAQNCHPEPRGAFTGEVAAEQVRDAGAEYILVGHSERRRLFCENDTVARAKLAAAWRAGLTPLLCVGETLAERERQETRTVVARQLQRALEGTPARSKLLVAYEPVWAIGTGVVATAEQVSEAHAWVREELRSAGRGSAGHEIPVLYGGSVDPRNAPSLAALPGVDGFLVGGASLDAGSFLAIAAALESAASAEASKTGRAG